MIDGDSSSGDAGGAMKFAVILVEKAIGTADGFVVRMTKRRANAFGESPLSRVAFVTGRASGVGGKGESAERGKGKGKGKRRE